MLQAALDLVGEHGIGALTLRPLAERIGVSVPTLTHHLGAKDQMIERLIGFASDQDRAFHESWVARASALGSGDAIRRAALADQAMQAWTLRARSRALLLANLLQVRHLPEGALAALAAWIGAWRTFWTNLGASEARGLALTSLLADELAFSLAMADRDAYVALRRLCLETVFAGLERGADVRAGAAGLFEHLRTELAPAMSVLETAMTPSPVAKRAEIARHAAALIVAEGVDGLTHRAVATAADVPASTVVYHFGAREDLLVAALEEVIRQFRQWRADASPARQSAAAALEDTRPLVRATSAIAFGAVWHPVLVPHAADMRRRRGENVNADNAIELRPAIRGRLDPLAAQTCSVCVFGARMVAMALGRDEQAAMADVIGALNASA